MHTSTVTQKGQIVIPAPLRRKLGFDQGTKVVIVEADGGIEVRPLDSDYFAQFAGLLSGEGAATQALLAYFEKEAGWDTVADLLADAAAIGGRCDDWNSVSARGCDPESS